MLKTDHSITVNGTNSITSFSHQQNHPPKAAFTWSQADDERHLVNVMGKTTLTEWKDVKTKYL